MFILPFVHLYLAVAHSKTSEKRSQNLGQFISSLHLNENSKLSISSLSWYRTFASSTELYSNPFFPCLHFYILSNALKKQLAANSLTLISKDNSNSSLHLGETDCFSCMARTGQQPLLLLPREEKRERRTPFTSATEGLEGTASNPLFLEMLKLLY